MKNSILLFSALLVSIIPLDKGIRQYTKENLQVIKSIDPLDTNFDDLAQIGSAIGNARVVMLGEQCHGDGATFLAKSRLIRYLHEVKGFNVLAFEADFFTLNNYTSTKKGGDLEVYKRIKRGINTIWSSTEECNFLINEYIPSTYASDQPLQISGFDNQFYGLFGGKDLSALLKQSLASGFDRDMTATANDQFFTALDTLASSVYKSSDQLRSPSSGYTSLINYLRQTVDTLLAHKRADQSDFQLQVLKNIKATSLQLLNYSNPEFASLRDSIMSDNLHWLLDNKFKNDKIIVWAANSHISKGPGTLSKITFHPMGSLFNKNPKHVESYMLGFTSRAGEHGVFKGRKISSPLSSNFESWIPADVNYGFLDLKSRPDLVSEDFYMRAFGHGNLKDTWQTKFDGVFYIREMYPSHRLQK